MKKTKRMKIWRNAKRLELEYKAYFVPIGYYKNRPAIALKLMTGRIGMINCFDLKYRIKP